MPYKLVGYDISNIFKDTFEIFLLLYISTLEFNSKPLKIPSAWSLKFELGCWTVTFTGTKQFSIVKITKKLIIQKGLYRYKSHLY